MNTWLSPFALIGVCRTFASAPESSAKLIRRMLTDAALTERGHKELFRVAEEIKYIVPYDSSLVADIYISAFGYKETSTDVTAIGSSQIFAFRSTRAQDYELALHVLAESYPLLLASNVKEATRVVISVVQNAEPMRRYRVGYAPLSEPFSFCGNDAQLLEDHSYSWDGGSLLDYGNGGKILNFWSNYLPSVGNSDPAVLQILLDQIGKQNRAAILWRRLLSCGVDNPETIGLPIRELLWAKPILLGVDTHEIAGRCINKTFEYLRPEDRERIERAILSLGRSEIDSALSSTEEWHRNYLLTCLPSDQIQLEETRTAISNLPTSSRTESLYPISVSSLDDDSWSGSEQVSGFSTPENTPQSELSTALATFRAFPGGSIQQEPRNDEILSLLGAAKELITALNASKNEADQQDLIRECWYSLAHAGAWLAKSRREQLDDKNCAVLAALLLDAANQEELPVKDSELEQFGRFPSWSAELYPRIYAAEGLMLLLRFGQVGDVDLRAAVLALSTDPRPAVRLQVATRVNYLLAYDPTFFWSLVDDCSSTEPDVQVAAALMEALFKVRANDPDRTSKVAYSVFNRFASNENNAKLSNVCTDIWFSLVIQKDHAPSRIIVNELIGLLPLHHDLMAHATRNMRNVLNYGTTESTDETADSIRTRAISLLMLITEVSTAKLEEAISASTPAGSVSDQEHISNLAKLLDAIGSEVYYASGVFEERNGNPTVVGDLVRKARFYWELTPLVDSLIEVGLARVAYQFIEMFDSYMLVNPREIFLMLEKAVRISAKRDGLAFEGLAVDRVVKVVSQYIADHRDLLRVDDECRAALISILNIFVEAGWQQAWRLTYKLEEIDR